MSEQPRSRKAWCVSPRPTASVNSVERELRLAGFWESIPARNRLKAELQKTLLQAEFKELPEVWDNRDRLISQVMEIAEKNNDTILYSE